MQSPKLTTFLVIGALSLGLIGAHSLVLSQMNKQSSVPIPAPASQLQKVVQPNAFFYSGVVANRSQTQVTINYSMADFPHVMHLDLVVADGSESISRLITHPLLTSLNWDYAESNGLRLYQKTKTYHSLSSFISNPPPGRTIVADEALLLKNPYKTMQAKPLNEFATLDGIEYIVTTYSPSQPLGNGHRYQTVLDASSALINLKKELVWHIRIPTATQDHPLYLGGVEVNYQ